MGIYQRILRGVYNTLGGEIETGDYLRRDQPISEWMDGLTAELDATAVACIATIASMLASLDLRAVNRDDWRAIPASDDNSGAYFNRIMNAVSLDGSGYDFKVRLFTDYLLYGNAFVYPQYVNLRRLDSEWPRSRGPQA